MCKLCNQKGNIEVLKILYKNPIKRFSLYELNKKTKICRNTLRVRIQYLESENLLKIEKDIGPRNKTLISLTPLGKEISSHIIDILKRIQMNRPS